MLESAIISEHHDSSTMYPEFARIAREEGLEDAAEWFDTLAIAEAIHLRYTCGIMVFVRKNGICA